MERLIVGERVQRSRLNAYREYALQLYDAEVAGVDRQIGRLRALLDELGLSESTLIAFTSDHGEEFLEHGMQGHSKQLFDESIRVPLILSGPGVPSGLRIQRPVENRRLGATLLELAGLEPKGELAAPNLLNEDVGPELPILTSTDLGSWRIPDGDGRFEVERRVRVFGAEQGGFRLHWSLGQGEIVVGEEPDEHHLRLYDLHGDPEELWDVKNLHPERALALREWIEGVLEASLEDERTSEDFLEAMGYADEQ
jgi:arylsulfatase A-like enzyme